jgi:hypothetical protein
MVAMRWLDKRDHRLGFAKGVFWRNLICEWKGMLIRRLFLYYVVC